MLTARWLSVAGIIGPLSRVMAQSKGAISVLTWGGLRDAISVAMALSLPAANSRSLILTLTYFVVVFSILIQGLTVGRVIRMTGGTTTTSPESSRH
jgi:CPA1 family monovalent cation:H+ antiporter